ncbi:alpha-(1-_3)-arabinofuranosyltransferase family protein [Candidatus Bathyarchaeota archaeon]|nr:alpha-(1->3)-arabinofuranosyltransferase family protein [Candidatus Bathyarchaeota archaeon]
MLKKNELLDVVSLVLILLAVIVSLRAVLLGSGFISKDDMTFPFTREQIRESLANRFYVWYGKVGGGFDPVLSSSIPFWSLYNLFGLLASPDILTKLFIMIPFIIAGCSMFVFSRRMMSGLPSLLASLLYVFNPWTFDRLASGHLNLLWGYSLIPIPLAVILNSKWKIDSKFMLATLTLGLILSFTMHTYVLVLFLVLLHAIFESVSSRSFDKRRILGLLLFFGLPLALNFSWLLPTFTRYNVVETTMIAPAVESSIIEVVNGQLSTLNTLRLTGYWLPYFRGSIDSLGPFSTIWIASSFMIPILSFVALYVKKDRFTVFFGLAALVFLLPPTIANFSPYDYKKLIDCFPPMALFRDSYKFIAVVGLSYSILMGSLLEMLLALRSKHDTESAHILGRFRLRRHTRTLAACISIILILSVVLIYSIPNMLSGDYMGQLNATNPPSYWFDVKDFLVGRNDSYSRVMWAPPFLELHYEWSNVSGVDPADEYLLSSYALSPKSRDPFVGSYLKYLQSSMYEDCYDLYLGKLLAPLAVKYVVVRLDARPKWAENAYPPSKLQEVFEHQCHMLKVFESGKWQVYENEYANSYATIPSSNPMLVLGDLIHTAPSLNFLSDDILPLLLYTDSGNYSSSDVDRIVTLANDMASTSTLIVAIPIDQPTAANNLLGRIGGETRLLYFAEGEKLVRNEKSIVPNYSFEDGLANWSLGSSAFSFGVSGDSTEREKGLEATTNCNASYSWSSISSEDLAVLPDTTYQFSADMKLINAQQSHIKILGFSNFTDEWETICGLPWGTDGTLNWTHNEFFWQSPKNITKIKVILNAGWVMDQSMGNATTLFDNITITPLSTLNVSFSNAKAFPLWETARIEIASVNASDYRIGLRAFSIEESTVKARLYDRDHSQSTDVLIEPNSLDFFYSPQFHLSSGNYTLELSSEKPLEIDMLTVMESKEENTTLENLLLADQPPAIVTGFKRNNPTNYVVTVNATKPFVLSLAEPYDQSWVAHVNGQRIESTPLYSLINGFWINQTGQLEITIEYEPQKMLYYGSIVSATTILGCLVYVVWDLRRSRVSRRR